MDTKHYTIGAIVLAAILALGLSARSNRRATQEDRAVERRKAAESQIAFNKWIDGLVAFRGKADRAQGQPDQMRADMLELRAHFESLNPTFPDGVDPRISAALQKYKQCEIEFVDYLLKGEWEDLDEVRAKHNSDEQRNVDGIEQAYRDVMSWRRD